LNSLFSNSYIASKLHSAHFSSLPYLTVDITDPTNAISQLTVFSLDFLFKHSFVMSVHLLTLGCILCEFCVLESRWPRSLQFLLHSSMLWNQLTWAQFSHSFRKQVASSDAVRIQGKRSMNCKPTSKLVLYFQSE